MKQLRGKVSIRELSERTKDLGYPISESVLTNFEHGRRGARLDVAELLIIAEAIQVPPAELLFSRNPDAEVEYLPGVFITAYEAGQVFRGAYTFMSAAVSSVIESQGEEVPRPMPVEGEVISVVDEREDLKRQIESMKLLLKKDVLDSLGMDGESLALFKEHQFNRLGQLEDRLNNVCRQLDELMEERRPNGKG